ncbi:cytochrome P450 2E1 [Trichonephila clavipes]|nr:cytochrome P450 2E1 [Trichonephila clavipes]
MYCRSKNTENKASSNGPDRFLCIAFILVLRAAREFKSKHFIDEVKSGLRHLSKLFLKNKISCQRFISNHASYNAVEFQLDKFWQLEELSETKPFTNEEIACENHFKRAHTRESTGRFVVNFPFRDSSDELGSSRDTAVHRLQQIERRFSKNKSLSDQYHKFMNEYLKLGHMELIPENEIDVPASSSFYLPHHPVPNKNGDKFRVVFDGTHKIAITADIDKTLQNSDFQRIVWRNSPFEPIQDFRLTRIAYGTASAPYLAIKCLQQLALNEAKNFPLTSKAALNDFYVDDLMSGANSLSEALELQNQLTQMLSSAGLVLRKWASSCNELLNSIDSDMRLSNASLNIDNDDTVNTLGILWHPASDVFYFKITPLSFEGPLTKRTLLSTIAKTFDPLGWLSPITIQYKTIMQRLWKQQLQWNERVSPDITIEWEQLAKDVQLVKDIKIPRFLFVDSDNQFHLFGFSDASEKAYAAAIYCRSVSDTEKINVQLIIAKTRVVPLKPVSLPRLELCGALLLVKLMDFTCKSLNYPISQTQFYTDSTIVLPWVGSHASRRKTFVANRVAKIQTLSSATQWHHISESANPADLTTRGVSSSTLLTSIWVGGRLRHANFAYGHKHPILLPKRHILTDVIVRHYHEMLLHAGTQLVQSCIQEKYWIIGARDIIRHLIRKCIKCCKVRASITNQMMGDLPSSRISPAPAFMRCGVDYAGSFQIKTLKGRGSKSFKTYIALFVCFTTRAIHLELVTDLSADAFIAALKRFIFCRGKCSDIYSDCGSNFVGAKRKLMQFENLAKSDNYNQNVSKFLTDNGFKWHQNIPGAPHMGGLWEAGIKSTKYHLKRVVGETKLT